MRNMGHTWKFQLFLSPNNAHGQNKFSSFSNDLMGVKYIYMYIISAQYNNNELLRNLDLLILIQNMRFSVIHNIFKHSLN